MTTYRTFVYHPAAQWRDAEIIAELPEELSARPKADWSNEPEPTLEEGSWAFDHFGYMTNAPSIRSGIPRLIKLKNVSVQRVSQRMTRYHIVLADGICADETYHTGSWISPRIGESAEAQVQTWQGEQIAARFNIMDDEPIGAVVDEPHVLISHKWQENHAHCLLETMSKFWCADQWPEGAPLIWDGSTLSQVECHRLFKVNHKCVVPSANRVLFKELWFPSFLCPFGTSRRQIDNLRNSLLIETAHRPQFEKIYISRGDAKERRVLNEPEVIAALKQRGFTSVILSNRSLRDQIATFRSAREIVMPHGAAGANLLFTPARAKVVEILPASYQHPMYGYVSAWSGHSYRRLVCADNAQHDMTVDVAQLMAALDA